MSVVSGEHLALELARRSAEPVVRVPLRVRFRAGLAAGGVRDALLPRLRGAGRAHHLGRRAAHGYEPGCWTGAQHAPRSSLFRSDRRRHVVVVFRAKPSWRGRRASRSGTAIRREQAPLLFPAGRSHSHRRRRAEPREIRLDTQVNASASFRGGTGSCFVAAISRDDSARRCWPAEPAPAGRPCWRTRWATRAGQRHGPDVLDPHGSTAGWAGVAYERDSWDASLARAAKTWELSHRHRLSARRDLRGLGCRGSCGALAIFGHGHRHVHVREMERDADRYEVALVGGDVFESTALAHSRAVGRRQGGAGR